MENNSGDQANKLWTKSKFDYGDFFLFLTVLNLIQDMKQNVLALLFIITTKTFREIQTICPQLVLLTLLKILFIV